MRRRGSLLVEVSMAATLVAVAMIAVVQLLAIAAQQERAVEQRRLAQREAANALEIVLASPWESLTPETLPEQTLSKESGQRLPDGELQLAVETVPGSPVMRRLTASVSWRGKGGDRERVQLAAWRTEPGESQP